MKDLKNVLPLLARILLSLVFLHAGIGKIENPAGTMGYMAGAGMPMVQLFFAGAVAVEVLGSIALILGFKGKWAALVMALFLVPVTLIFHTHWSDAMQLGQFLKNAGLIGGLLMIFTFGTGDLTVERLLKK